MCSLQGASIGRDTLTRYVSRSPVNRSSAEKGLNDHAWARGESAQVSEAREVEARAISGARRDAGYGLTGRWRVSPVGRRRENSGRGSARAIFTDGICVRKALEALPTCRAPGRRKKKAICIEKIVFEYNLYLRSPPAQKINAGDRSGPRTPAKSGYCMWHTCEAPDLYGV